MKLLNLDGIVEAKRTVTISGSDYVLNQRSVGQMISAIQAVKSLEESESLSEMDQMGVMFESMLDAAKGILPECPEEVLRALSMNKLNALIEFANEVNQDPAAAEGDENSEMGKN